MSAIAFLIERTAIGWYIVFAAGIMWYWRKWMVARFAYRATNFELERDMARNERGSAFTAMVLMAEALLFVVGVQQVVAPTVRSDLELMAEPIEEVVMLDGAFMTPTRSAPSGELPGAVDPSGFDLNPNDNAQAIFATPTLTATPVGTILPNAPDPVGCDTPNATLRIPANGMRVFQPIQVAGTAFVENFSNYKIEISSLGGQFAVLDSQVIPVNEQGTLSQFTPIDYDPGTYLFRLMVFDTSNTLRASCQVTIYISEPIPTATPIGET